jgi:hypothetical protein
MEKLSYPISSLTTLEKRTYKRFLKDLKKKKELNIQQFNIDFRNLFFVPWKWKIRIPFTIYIRNTISNVEDKIMAEPEFAEILKNRSLLQIEEYKVKYVKMINMIKMSINKKDYEDILFVTFKKRYFYPYLTWHAAAQKFLKINTDMYDIFYFENDKLPWIKLDCHFLFDTELFIIKFMNEWADGFIDPTVLNVKDFFVRFNQPFPTMITFFHSERFRQQMLDMIAFQLIQTRNNYWKELCTSLMGRNLSAFMTLRREIELSWVDNLVLRISFPFLSGQSIRIMNKHSKKIKMNKFKSFFHGVKKKIFLKKKTKKKTKKDTKKDLTRKNMLLNTGKYGRKTKVKKVGR